MSNFKTRVEELQKSTSSDQAVTACKDALSKYKEYATFNLPTHQFEKFEQTVAESLIEALDNIQESAVNSFLTIEKRIVGINNLGVRKALAGLKNSGIAKNPSTMYMLESLLKLEDAPEWLTINAVIERLSAFGWDKEVNEHLSVLKVNATKYAEDIKIYSAVHEAKNSRSNFVISSLQKDIDTYLNYRTSTNRAKLLESLAKYNYDGNVRKLHNVILETEKSFQIKTTSNDAMVKPVYSPVLISENDEVFAVNGKAYVKRGSDVRPLTEEEYTKLPQNFTWISKFLTQQNVEVSENKIKVFSSDKKVELIEEADGLKIGINGKIVTTNEFHNIFLKAGIFRVEEREVINAVNKLIENWDCIYELDFAKTIIPQGAAHRRVDIFKISNKIHINREDTLMKENIFYGDCNATQSRSMVLEFANYDLGKTFTSFLSEEELHLNTIESSKKEFLDSIEYLQNKKNMLENHSDSEIRESAEVKEIIALINEEIDAAKKSYLNLQNKAKSLTTIQEGVGAIAGDEVEYLKKKQ